MQIKTILVATDFSEDANSARDYAVEFSKVFESRLRLIHAYHVDTPAVYGSFDGGLMIPQDILEPIRRGAEASIEVQVKELAAAGLDVEGRAVNKNAVSAILEEAEQLSADLIVMGTRGLTGLKHVLVGSTAERTVRLAQCPVVTVKAKS
jgi:nucleotide-binding universal stress UspA family protein